MTDIQIANNVLPQGYADDIERDLTGSNFPWFYVNDVTNPDTYGSPGLSNLVYDYRLNTQTEYYRYLKPMTYFIEEVLQQRIETLLRIRIGFLTKQPGSYNLPHLDYISPHYTACYYVNDCDGDTVLFKETLRNIAEPEITFDTIKQYAQTNELTEIQRCTPAKNKLCVFNGHRFHASSHPINSPKRFVITFNFTTPWNAQ